MDYEPLIDTKKLGQKKQKESCWWGIGWAVFAAACTIAFVYGLIMRGAI